MSQGEARAGAAARLRAARRGPGARVQAAPPANLIVERYNPRPDSEEEDAAQLDGIEAQQLMYRRAVLPRHRGEPARPQAGDPGDLAAARAPARVRPGARHRARRLGRAAEDRPDGRPAGARRAASTRSRASRSEPWVLANELKRDFDVKEVPMSAKEIDKDINVLLVIHPRDMPPQTEYALDQFVLRGGKLIAFVDPYAYFDQEPTDARRAAAALELHAADAVQGLGHRDGPGQGGLRRGVRLRRRRSATRRRCCRSTAPRSAATTSSPARSRRCSMPSAARSRSSSRWPEGDRAGPELAELDAGGQHQRHQVGRRGDPRLQAVRATPCRSRVRLTGKFKTAFPDGLTEKDKPVAGTPALRESAPRTR